MAIMATLKETLDRHTKIVSDLVEPLGNMTWPRKNYVQLKHRVDRVARCQPVDLRQVRRPRP